MEETGHSAFQLVTVPAFTLDHAMPEDERDSRASARYATAIATLVGICALAVSAYTAYVQRQQVRAAVWPIVEFNTSNDPAIVLTLQNKGVGPAIIRHVIVRVNGQPVTSWHDALQILLGPGYHRYTESTMTGHVLAAGESMNVLVPHNEDNSPLTFDRSNPLWVKLDKARAQIDVEICYSSTLGENWTLRSGAGEAVSTTVECRTCPERSATSFRQ
jgi:hypothetical protein